VFVGKFTLDAVRPVCFGGVRGSEDAAHDWETLDLLSRLVNKSLVTCETAAEAAAANGGAAATASSGQTGYRLLETVRQYGRDRLNESGETRATRERHRDWFLGLAEGGGTDQTDLTR
jgi:non-specific serine/threonine protein kinase